MKSARSFAVVLVTAPNVKVARNLAQAVLHARLAACVNLVPKIESHYWWQGKLEQSNELLLVIKTAKSRLAALEQCLQKHHPYDTPEILAIPVESGAPKYLAWLANSVK